MWLQGKFAGIFSVVASLATFLFGTWDPSLQIMTMFLIMDFITGVLQGWYSGTLSSKAGYRGIIKKAGILCVIIVANLLDVLTGQHLFRMPIVYFFIATEGISILENLARMGVPIPSILLTKLEQLKGPTGPTTATQNDIENAKEISQEETPKE